MNDSSSQPRTPSEEIAGLVERVTFFNEESGFAVLRVKVQGQRELVTVLGSLPSVSAGEWLTAEGWWVRDREHCLQFKAQVLKAVPNPVRPGEAAAERFGWRFQVRDKVIQTENNYKKEVFNGDIGMIEKIDPVEQEVSVLFDDRLVVYDYGELDEVSLAYAVTIHKSQGSEFPAVVIPVAMQHYMLLQRNLIYTGITRAKRLLVVVGQKKAQGLAVRNDQSRKRYSGLLASLKETSR